MLLLVLGGIGLTLAGLGIYGVTARSVEERSRSWACGWRWARRRPGCCAWSWARPCGWWPSGWRREERWPQPRPACCWSTLPDLEQAEAWWAVPAVTLLAAVAAVAAAFRLDGR